MKNLLKRMWLTMKIFYIKGDLNYFKNYGTMDCCSYAHEISHCEKRIKILEQQLEDLKCHI